MSKLGDVIDGKYEILKEIGRGGMSIVYLAMDNRLNKQWAVKEIRKKGSNSGNQIVVQSLLAEANLMKRLDHPHLPRIVDIIDNGGIIYIVMDYIEGEPLDKLLKAKGAQDQEAVIEWGKQLSEVLDYLHTREPAIIYRDMKPANVMLRPDGTIKLIDFGIAREYKEQNSSDTVSLGTKGYAAPEQFGGMGQTDARTDVYCLGVTLYHLVTGNNPTEPPYEILPVRSVNPKLSSGLEAIIQKCTQLNPDDRFQSCAEVLYALNHLGEFDGAYKQRQQRKRNVFFTAVAATVGLMLTGFGCFIGYKETLSQTIQSCIAQYGSESPSDGDCAKMTEALDDIGMEINENSLNDLLIDYVKVCKKDLQNIIEQHKITGINNFNSEEKDKIDSEEIEIFKALENVERHYIQRLSEAHAGRVYYSIGELYMENYKLSEGKYDTNYIQIRYEETGSRFKKIKSGLTGEDKVYVDNIAKIAKCIEAFSSKNNKLTDDTGISEAIKIEKWKVMNTCVNLKDGSEVDAKQINMHLVISSILSLNRAEFSKLSRSEEGRYTIDSIYVFINKSVELLKHYQRDNPDENESLVTKVQYAISNYSDACLTITGNEIGGTSQ